ncbi:acyloxyacyl hydrolase [Marinigracilibium pacificum]|uniref:Acyloxyacyl hydrolase n=1 Tax=Marinigracilibium pacificum TaxID=2729599 RepID=A0A848JAM4_9BACT|nr:acyloxyacyl hydrolase [Marinigracilibium pacificum]NMM50092.1 acyloxyacyl hydrolase [Marinigracilibium pacificum]
MNFRILSVLTLVLGSHFLTVGQGKNSQYQYTYGAEFNRGFIMKHGPEVGILSQNARPTGFAFHLLKSTSGYRQWEKDYNLPTLKFSFNYFDLNQQYMGSLLGLTSTIQFNLITTRKVVIDFAPGAGISYTNKPFDAETNNKNVLLGTAFNTVMRADLTINYLVNENWKVYLSIGMFHASNGSISDPNKGINLVNSGLGLKYTPAKDFSDQEPVKTQISHKDITDVKFALTVSSGVQQEGSFDTDEREEFYNASFLYYPIVQNRGKWAVGLDYFHNLAIKKHMSRMPEFMNSTPPDFRRVGLTAGYQVDMGRFASLFQLGYYVYNKAQRGQHIYQRYSARYHVTKNFGVHLGLRAHGGKAENLEFGIFGAL